MTSITKTRNRHPTRTTEHTHFHQIVLKKCCKMIYTTRKAYFTILNYDFFIQPKIDLPQNAVKIFYRVLGQIQTIQILQKCNPKNLYPTMLSFSRTQNDTKPSCAATQSVIKFRDLREASMMPSLPSVTSVGGAGILQCRETPTGNNCMSVPVVNSVRSKTSSLRLDF